MTIVVFNPTAFKAQYPIFAAVSDPVLQGCFDQAGLFLSNADNSPVQDISRRTMLLNLLVAHIGMLQGVVAPSDGPSPVGRVSSGSEGSVSASFDYNLKPGSSAWFTQTQYGATFWQATSQMRTMRYFPQPTRP